MKIRKGNSIIGAAGNATKILFEYEDTDLPDIRGTLSMWFIDCPGQHPAWRYYHIVIFHLRPLEGGTKPATINRPGATHEIILSALDPSGNPVPDDLNTWHMLSPLNLMEQTILQSDVEAERLLDHAVQCVVDGMLWAEPPLSGQTYPWREWIKNHERIINGETTTDSDAQA